MGFEQFVKRDAVAVNKSPQISVNPNGLISLTWRAYELMEKPEAVEFLFDRSRNVVALVGVKKGSQNGYTLRLPRNGAKGKVSVRGNTFFAFYEIDISKGIKAEPFTENEMLCFAVSGDPSAHAQSESAGPSENTAPQISANESEPSEVPPS